MPEPYLLSAFQKAFQDLISIKSQGNLKVSKILLFHSQSKRMILVDTVGSNLLMNKALWKQIWQ